jgi:eukaryotic-like serine/threonine-protein kinase
VTTAPQSDLSTSLVGRYTIERELGSGGMAVVYLARDLKHDRMVAIKVVRPEISATLGAERFLREIRIAAHLQHPNILPLIDSGELPAEAGPGAGKLYYVMPFVNGETLRERMVREGRLPLGEAVRILRDVVDALAHAHQQGIVHRDIKPENIMLSGRHALVMDFGIARAATTAAVGSKDARTLTSFGLAIGTPAYMAPEQAAGQADVDARADLYAVGVVAYEMLAGVPPFSGTTPQAILASQLTRTPPPLAERCPEIPPPLARAVTRCLEKDPANRWPSAETLLTEFEKFPVLGGSGSKWRGDAVARHVRRHWRIFAPAALVVAVLVAWLAARFVRRTRETRWAREQGIPRLLALGEAGQWHKAYALARRVEAAIPGDSLFNVMRPRFARRMTLHTTPSGATVQWKDYAAPDSAWALLGRTPLDSVLLPSSPSPFINSTRVRITAPGYRTLDLVWFPFGDSIRLDSESALPPEMVRVAGGEISLETTPGFAHVRALPLPAFLMDRFEVTNREFRRFVDSGGYRRRELWTGPFVRDGHTIPWEQAMALMIDRTRRPGPSTWEGGEYPKGHEDYPVGGVSWYEAAAYAKFAGKSLPTVYHWFNAASIKFAASIIPASNFSGQGPARVGSHAGSSAFGIYDMAGNVREWCLNASGQERFILGGGWNDEPYQFTDPYTQPPFDRSPTNGIRLVKYSEADSTLAVAGVPLHRAMRDFLKIQPAPDAIFAVYRRMYEYDRTPLHAQVLESVDEGDWTRELVALDAAYAGDRLLLYLYLPKRSARPYPAVVYFPGSSAIGDRAPQNLQWRSFSFILNSGRAVLYPVYKGTYQRSDSLHSDVQDSSNFYRDHVVMWAKDMRRAIDYVETRPEVSTGQLAYYGVSWGGAMGALMPAVEPRIRSSVLYVSGLDFEPARPEADPINFLPRIRVPTLMLNGRYDFFFPLASSQDPMFRLLGTPTDQKRHIVEDGSHFVSRARLIGETLAWLDKYQPLPHP